jgi:transcriptional regulator with XRE-family HTH domain
VSTKARQNVIGPKIRQLRYQLKLTQNELAARIGLQGWDISRGTLSQIEAQIRCVTDYELLCLSRALRVSVPDLLPSGSAVKKTLDEFYPEKPSE